MRQRTGPQRATTLALTLWSPHLIPTEQDSEENQKDSAHETEVDFTFVTIRYVYKLRCRIKVLLHNDITNRY